MKKQPNKFLLTAIAIILLFTACKPISDYEHTEPYLYDDTEKLFEESLDTEEFFEESLEIHLPEFLSLDDGMLVDARIPEELISTVLRHFEAIRDEDVSAFWDTLMGEDGVDFNHFLWLTATFFPYHAIESFVRTMGTDISVSDRFIDHGDLSDRIRPNNRDMQVTRITAFNSSEVWWDDPLSMLRVDVRIGEDSTPHWLLPRQGYGTYDYIDGEWVHQESDEWFIVRHESNPRFGSWAISDEVLLIDFIARNYPALITDREPDSDYIPTAAKAYNLHPHDLTLVMDLTEQASSSTISRVYRHTGRDFQLVEEALHGLEFRSDAEGIIYLIEFDHLRNIDNISPLLLSEIYYFQDLSGMRHRSRRYFDNELHRKPISTDYPLEPTSEFISSLQPFTEVLSLQLLCH